MKGVTKENKTLRTEFSIKLIDKFYQFLWKNPKPIKVLYGGSGSAKTHSIAQRVCQLFMEDDDISILVARKTRPALKLPKAPWPLVQDMLDAWEVPYTPNKSDMYLTHRSNKIVFSGLDDPEKFKSSEYDYIWLEETTDFNYEDFLQLDLRIGRTEGDAQIFMSFNPIDAFHWCVTEMVQGNRTGPDGDVAVMHSTYKDNPFLSQAFCDKLENLINTDENFHRVYAKGEPGVLKHIIYTNYDVQDFETFPLPVRNVLPLWRGLDVGYNNETCLMDVWMYQNELYFNERLYVDGFTDTDLKNWMISEDVQLEKNIPIYYDPNRPDYAETLKRAGFNMQQAENAVKPGINYLKAHFMHFSSSSLNAIQEIRQYKWKTMKFMGKELVLDEPVKFKDHAMDACRYPAYTNRKRQAERVPKQAFVPDNKMPIIYHSDNLPFL